MSNWYVINEPSNASSSTRLPVAVLAYTWSEYPSGMEMYPQITPAFTPFVASDSETYSFYTHTIKIPYSENHYQYQDFKSETIPMHI